MARAQFFSSHLFRNKCCYCTSFFSLYPPTLDPDYQYDSTEDLLPSEDSGSSVGVAPGVLETSVDADLDDVEYMHQIQQRVFSPVDEGT